MRRFRFPLARLQRLRAHEERAARRALAASAAEVRRIEEQLTVVAANRSTCDDERGAAQALGQALAASYARSEAALRGALRESEVHLERARARYAERRRELEGLVRLRDRRREAWRVDAEREMQREFDESALRRFVLARRVK